MTAAWQHRWHPLREEWVQVSALSSLRPWSGAMVDDAVAEAPEHDPGCYLCPGVTRANEDVNPDYTAPFAFDNDFPSLSADVEAEVSGDPETDPLRCSEPPRGRCRVMCWSPRHDLTLADLPDSELTAVIQLWRDEYLNLSAEPDIAQVSIFENKGIEIGVSNLHPHGQIYATGFVTDTGKRQRTAQANYARRFGAPLLQSLLSRPEYEADHADSLWVASNAEWRAVVPYFARFPFEVWIIPERPMAHLGDASQSELSALGALYGRVLRQFDALFARRTPHNTLVHNAPCDGHPDNATAGFHLVVQCPLRAPGMMKFMGGYEQSAGNIVNPVQPEIAASRLRDAGANA